MTKPGLTFARLLSGSEGELLLISGSCSLQRMVSEIIVAFLGSLPLDPRPKSRPFTPCVVVRTA